MVKEPDRCGRVDWRAAMTTELTRIGTEPMANQPLFGMGAEELRAVVEGLGLPKYRAVQLGEALYKQRVGSLEHVTTLPLEVRERLAAEGLVVGLPEIVQT